MYVSKDNTEDVNVRTPHVVALPRIENWTTDSFLQPTSCASTKIKVAYPTMCLSCSSDTYSDGRVRLLCGFSSNCKRSDNTLHVHCQYPWWRTFKVTFHSLSNYQICHNEYLTFTKMTKLHLLGWKLNASWLENKAHSKILNDVKCNLPSSL